ncbi:probable WRKY transcription factor 13 isoform X2 [Abrus precatorius]|uniref:Probable WRKY transcription factor 13 isoform X2 n=1 Tax=Abrus precatorius TaxID=3816 RepID=A0A8B8MH01_ABRPR|nr:probable WRKY transcription factor 13 isoform X2 [Abrus precatorius]
MSTTSQTIVHHSLFEEQDQNMTTQMGFFPFPTNISFPPLGCHQSSLKTFSSIAPSSLAISQTDSASNLSETLFSTTPQKSRADLTSSFGGAQFLSLHRSSINPWALGEVADCFSGKRSGVDDHHLGISAMKMKKIKGRRKVREPRFCFKTMSDVDVLDDGYKWRKYGQKVVKNTQHPSYYRCTQDNCRVKKRVERLAEDPRMVITTYEGRHVHSPSNDLEDSQSPSQLGNFLW